MSSSLRSRIAPWLALARISNAPTVVSNAFCGVALGASLTHQPVPLLSTCGIAIGAVALYVAGMMLNDVMDAPLDAVERPGRPIPSGRVSRSHAMGLVLVLLVTGIALPALIVDEARWGVMVAISATIALCVAAYNILHTRWAASVVLLGVCRGLVLVLGASSLPTSDGAHDVRGLTELVSPEVALRAMILAAYVGIFSWIARREIGASGVWRSRLAWTMPAVAIILLSARESSHHPSWLGASGIARSIVPIGLSGLFTGWLARSAWLWSRREPGDAGRVALKVHAVMGWIAGVSLLDAYVVATLRGPWWWVLVPLGCFVVTIVLQRRVLGS